MIKDILDSQGKGIVGEIQDNHFKADQNASGQTIASLQYTIEENKEGFVLLVDAVKHFPVLENGRKAGKMPPVKSIIDWTNDRGIPESEAWGIAKAIAKSGSRLFQQGGRKDIYSNVINDKRINEILQQVAKGFEKESLDSIDDSIED